MYETAVRQPTICWPVYVVGSVTGVELRVDGPRFAALLAVDSEEPAAS